MVPGQLLEQLPKDPVIVEAGAFDGLDTRILADGSGFHVKHVYAFEPLTSANVAAYVGHLPNVTIVEAALGEVEGDYGMHTAGPSSSLLAPKEHLVLYPNIRFDCRTSVQVVRLDAWAERSGVERVDGLWLDVQGGELEALKGAGSLLDGVAAIVLEMSLVEMYEGQALWPEVRGWLEDRGFELFDLQAQTPEWGDALMVRSK